MLGGYIGFSNQNITIQNSTSSQNISGSLNQIGGFIGQSSKNVTIIDSLITHTNLSGNTQISGFVGQLMSTLFITNSKIQFRAYFRHKLAWDCCGLEQRRNFHDNWKHEFLEFHQRGRPAELHALQYLVGLLVLSEYSQYPLLFQRSFVVVVCKLQLYFDNGRYCFYNFQCKLDEKIQSLLVIIITLTNTWSAAQC
ncbi:Hypothetical_protein [Hexamita inflata]|uniref:Hypothetical_protein n=1 Tax=Hexamita inflata TaxID=28002 RepID=A0AA86RIR8_9EUKA|nr:Hypothetical protein HINF_LOCUS66486 [Hexamita inflata]CAI9978847.1 Hypothetical protein HINF_LOCUS66492 [Hexamita inflata]